ncbi:hypothetical protein L5D93_17680 [Paenibacillus thiaminolyticus]|nr:hypothetical protein [Paenibacillus thiaminolyticus]
MNTRMNPLMERVQSGVGTETACKRPVNPKRLARILAREMLRHGMSSQSHEALRLELEIEEERADGTFPRTARGSQGEKTEHSHPEEKR